MNLYLNELKKFDEWNRTASLYQDHKMLHQLFEDQVEKQPNAVAILYKNDLVTYEELNKMANCLAHQLCHNGISANDLVAISLEPSIELFVGILAILKSG